MQGAHTQKILRRAIWGLASLLLVGCEVGSSTKSQSPYRAPSSSTTGVSTSSTSAEVTTSLSVNVTVKDKSGYGIQNVVPTIGAANTLDGSSTGITSGGCGATNASGVAVCSLRSTVAGSFYVKVLTPVQATMLSAVTFYQVPRSLSFTSSPSASTVSLVVFATQPIVKVLDAAGVAVPGGKTASGSGTGVVTLSLTTANGATLSSTTGLTAIANSITGIATFANLKVDLASTYTLKASLTDPVSGTITGTSSSFAITAAVATKLAFATSPSSSSTGVAFTTAPVVVQQDASGNTVSSGTSSNSCLVTLTLTSPNTGDELRGIVLSKTQTSGSSDFSGQNLRVVRVGTGTDADVYTLVATGSGTCAALTTATSSSFTITLVGLPSQLSVTQSPGTAALNEIWTQQPIVQVLDEKGTLVSTDNSTIVVMTVTTTPGGSLAGTTSVQAVNGVATFTGLSIPATSAQSSFAGSYTYTFTGTNSSRTLSTTTVNQTITSYGLVPAAVLFKNQPTGAVAINQTMADFTVKVVDSNGYLCAFDQSSTVTVANATGYSGFTSATVTVVNGVATFSGKSISSSGAKQLAASGTSASAVSFASVNSNLFLIQAYGTTADHLVFTQQPSSATASPIDGAAWTNQPIVEVVDSAGNVMANDNTTIVKINCVLPLTCSGEFVGNPLLRVTNGIANFATAGAALHLGGGAYGTGGVTSEMISATSTNTTLPVTPTFGSATFGEP